MSKKESLLYPELSYNIVGLCFSAHNELGRFVKEKKYGDFLAQKMEDENLSFKKELIIGESGSIADFLVEDKIVLELKAKRVITKRDYTQVQRYLQETGARLGILVNFRTKYLSPKRVVRYDR